MTSRLQQLLALSSRKKKLRLQAPPLLQQTLLPRLPPLPAKVRLLPPGLRVLPLPLLAKALPPLPGRKARLLPLGLKAPRQRSLLAKSNVNEAGVGISHAGFLARGRS